MSGPIRHPPRARDQLRHAALAYAHALRLQLECTCADAPCAHSVATTAKAGELERAAEHFYLSRR